MRNGRPTLEVENAGPIVAADQVEALLKPFVRAGENGNASEASHGLGLGLSIVQAIAEAHDAQLTTIARPEGGLRVTIAFPSAGPDRRS